SGKMAKDIFEEMKKTGDEPWSVFSKKDMKLISDEAALEGLVDQVLAANPENVAKYRGGKKKVLGFFVGQVMAQTKGQADPKLVNEILKRKLDE
ncbi:MAG: Asp-tRNA(Asn)/Glu-tRNA(Gln) amidotransferase GatCAB subunit B, partial [Deltaproteobacteria bacterium]|nr:Asp-tRNA(Asn)/Glu-tRNA(Gln) amidotransferase GatCAB subunit B [Deltaproteobacteria bacterium]